MRKVVYGTSVSIDGFIAAADGDLSWAFPDEELHRHFNDRESMIDIHLYGRRMYEGMVSFWPTADENPSAPDYEIEYARIWQKKRKLVFSKTLDQVGWNARLVRGNITEEINKLKAEPGKDMSIGGSELASAFVERSLIDEFWLYVCPVVL